MPILSAEVSTKKSTPPTVKSPLTVAEVKVPTLVISVCAGFTFAVVTASSAISPVAIVPSVIPKDFIFVIF